MPWGVAAGAAIGAAGSIGSSFIGAGAAGNAAAQQAAQFQAGREMVEGTQRRLLSLYDPFIQAGQGATSALQSEAFTPAQLSNQRAIERLRLEQQNPAMSAVVHSPEEEARLNKDIQAWKQKLSAFDKETQLMMTQSQMGTNVTETPAFKYQAELTNRSLAAQGLLGSQAAIAQQGAVAANAYNQRLGILSGLSGQGLNAVGSYGGIASNLTNAAAGFQASIGQAQAQGTLGQANAWQQGITGAANAVTGAGSALLNYSMYNNLINRLNTNPSMNTNTWDPVMGTGPSPSGTSQASSLRQYFGMTGNP